ncbi:MAG: DNA translocase FtsK [Christensenellales bacterium]
MKRKLTYEKKRKILTWTGISILVLCSFAFLVLFTGLIKPLKHFLLGTFGLFSYPLFIVLFFVGLAMINKKKYVLPVKYAIYVSCALISLLAIIQNIIVGNYVGGFFDFLAYNYTKQLTPGGIIIGLVISPFKFAFGSAGVYAIFSILLIVFGCLIADYLFYVRRKARENAPIKIQKQKEEEKRQRIKEKQEAKLKTEMSSEWILDNEGNLVGKDGSLFSSKGEEDVHAKTLAKFDNALAKKREKPKITLDAKIEEQKTELSSSDRAKKKLGLLKKGEIIESSEPIAKEPTLHERLERHELTKKEYLLTPPKLTEMAIFSHVNHPEISKSNESTYFEEVKENITSLKEEKNFVSNSTEQNIEKVSEKPFIEEQELNSQFVDFDDDSSFDTPESKAVAGDIIEKIMKDEPNINISAENLKPAVEKTKLQQSEKPKNKSYVKPTLDLLFDVKNDYSELEESVQQKAVVLENALETFNINAKVTKIIVGPSVTRYELEMPVGVPVKKILAHQDDIALNLASNGDIRIEAPIPGRSVVGIEVPNDKISTVGIKEILSSKEFQEAKSPLSFALGKEISGAIRICNLAKMPHLLVAGSTGSGKSVCLNSIIISLLYKSSPEDLKLILIDPKRVEFSMYNELPHLMLPNVITETDKAVNALTWAVNEMERRYGLFQESKARNLDEYNSTQAVLSGETKKLPFIVIIIDELADLMMLAKKDIEEKIMRLAQKARAAGIHLILATQRPSVNVITGTIKANFPSRIAFAVTSYVDSKTILDASGAEKLLGKGDMLYAPSDQAEPTRIQGCYIDGKEVDNVVEFIKKNNNYEFDLDEARNVVTAPKGYGGNPFAPNPNQSDELLPYALKLFIENGQASITMLQRRFRIGFSRAANLVDEMEQKGYVGPAEGSKQRPVFMTMDEFRALFGDVE